MIDDREAFVDAFRVSRETLDRLNLYESVLRRWQPTINLIAPATLDAIWHRHFADSAQLAALLPKGDFRMADLGSGAGFPGLVLAIMLADRPGVRLTLVESDHRKGAFLREVARHTGVAVDILSIRIENPETHARLGVMDVVSARALAPLTRLLGLAAPLFAADTLGVFPKGRDAQAEVDAARSDWAFDAALVPSVTEPRARIVVVTSLGRKSGSDTEG